MAESSLSQDDDGSMNTGSDEKSMSGNQVTSFTSDICKERCNKHKDEPVKYFCQTHNVCVCTVCVTIKHQLCNDVAYIPEAAADISESQEFIDFQTKMEKLIKQSECITKAAQSNIKLSADYRAKAVQEIENYRQELNHTLDKLKEELLNQSEEMQVKDSEKMSTMADTCNQVIAELQQMSSDIKLSLDKKQHYKLFIDMKNAEHNISAMQDKLPGAEDICVTAVRFQPNLELQNLLQTKYAFGHFLVKSPSKMDANFLADINVKYRRSLFDFTPRRDSYITSAALLSETKLVITDERNMSVKLIDTEHKRIQSEYKTEKAPNDVTIIGNDKVAITLPNAKKIQILKLEDELCLDDEIIFGTPCVYIACVDDNLVVSFDKPYEVKILNMTGEVLQICTTNSQGDRLFSSVPRLSVSSFNQAIYASDSKENRVTMLNRNGHVLNVYEDGDLHSPWYTAIDDTGMVYLCGTGSHNIHLLTPDCRKVKILLSHRDGIRGPQCICFCNMARRLYVSMVFNDNIKVFQLT